MNDRTAARHDRGMALIGVLILTGLLTALGLTLVVSVTSDTRLRGAFVNNLSGFYAAESGLNKGMSEYRNIFLDYNVPHGSDFDEREFALGTRKVFYELAPRSDNPRNVMIPSGELFSGLNAIQYRYVVNSKSVSVNSDTEAEVGAEFLVAYVPLFQFAAFYTNDLEILPGPTMVLNGRVHTNGDLYFNAVSELKIADSPGVGVYTVQVSAGKDIYRGRKDRSECKGTVNVDMLQDKVAPLGDLDPRGLPCSGADTRLVQPAELAQWRGSMLSRISNIAVPQPDVLAKGHGVYWKKADLRIVLKLNQPDSLPGSAAVLPHSIEVQDVDGNRDATRTAQLHAFVTDKAWNLGTLPGVGPSTYPGTLPIFYTDVPLAGAGCGCSNVSPGCNNDDKNCYGPGFSSDSRVYAPDMKFDGDYRRGGYYNWRERKWMLLLNINATDLLLWNQQHGNPFFNPADSSDGGIVIFATLEGPDSAKINNYGVRIFGSANLPIPSGIGVSADPTGLTVVSDQAIYVLGDFNRGLVSPSDLPRQPASLIGDSLNVMSNAYWNPACVGNFCRDAQSVISLGNPARAAASTWINAAFLGGVDTTPSGFSGGYNGGLENYPRFHENWGGVALNYQGSFVSLGEPQHVNGPWCGTGNGCNIYNPPVRNWNFDPAFNDVANLPPLTPRFVYVQQVLFTEDFK